MLCILLGDLAPPKVSSSITSKKGIFKFSPKIGKPDNSSTSLPTDGETNQCESSGARDNGDASQNLSSNIHHLKLDKKSTHSKKTISIAEYKPEKWVLSDQEGTLNQLNLAIVSYHRVKPGHSFRFLLKLLQDLFS